MNNKKNFVFLHSKEPSVCIFPSNVSFSLVNEFPLSHTFKQKSAFFDSIFAKYIYLYSINYFTTTPMKFLPKFGNQKLTLDLVINTYKYPLITMKSKIFNPSSAVKCKKTVILYDTEHTIHTTHDYTT